MHWWTRVQRGELEEELRNSLSKRPHGLELALIPSYSACAAVGECPVPRAGTDSRLHLAESIAATGLGYSYVLCTVPVCECVTAMWYCWASAQHRFSCHHRAQTPVIANIGEL